MQLKRLAMIGLALLGAAALAAPARAGQDPLTMQWRSTYTFQNKPVQAQVTLNGDGTGSYTLKDGTQGDLTNVDFTPGGNNPGGPASAGTYTGSWSLGGDTGTFTWTVNYNFTAFNGNWNSDNGGGGKWSGTRTAGPLQPIHP